VWWLALIFAAGLGVAPLAVSLITDIGVETGLRLAAGFAGFGLLANAAVVLFTRSTVFGKVVVMTVVGALVTGVFLLTASAYLLGRKHGIEHASQPGNPGLPTPGQPGQPGPPNPGNPGNPGPGPGNPPPLRPGLLTATDAAYYDGVYRFS